MYYRNICVNILFRVSAKNLFYFFTRTTVLIKLSTLQKVKLSPENEAKKCKILFLHELPLPCNKRFVEENLIHAWNYSLNSLTKLWFSTQQYSDSVIASKKFKEMKIKIIHRGIQKVTVVVGMGDQFV